MPSLTLKYLRGGSVTEAATKMRNQNEHPVCIRPTDDNPLTNVWDNKSEILWKFGIHILAAEGLTATSVESRPILVYIQHGRYYFSRTVRKQKKVYLKPVLHALHFSLTANRSRFVDGCELHFKQFYKLLDKHPNWEKFLDDRDSGLPPQSYLVAVEAGIRAFAMAPNAKLTMGVGKGRVVTKEMYATIAPFRKAE